MKNLNSYITTNQTELAKEPFNSVDALALCWLSYLNFPNYLKEGEGAKLKDVICLGTLSDGEMYADAFNPKTSKKFFTGLTKSRRFNEMIISDFTVDRDEEREIQFGALCIRISDDEYFLSFRGTDPSFVGWKEDFNSVRLFPVPSQVAAAEYAKKMMLKHAGCKFYFGGHSKGGNSAVYAAIALGEEMKEKVLKVYNFDGPGFFSSKETESEYSSVMERVIKIVPNASFVGMLMEKGEDYRIIKSRNVSFLQHDPFSWEVRNKDFLYREKKTRSSIKIERAVNRWIETISKEDKKRFTEIVFTALSELDTDNFNVFFKTLYRQIPALFKKYRRLKEDDRAFFGRTMQILFGFLYNKRAKKQ